jgi:hypothetical protein
MKIFNKFAFEAFIKGKLIGESQTCIQKQYKNIEFLFNKEHGVYWLESKNFEYSKMDKVSKRYTIR